MMHSLQSAAPLTCIEQICALSPFAAYDLRHRLSHRRVRFLLEWGQTRPSVHPHDHAYCRLPISSCTPKVSTRGELIASLLKAKLRNQQCTCISVPKKSSSWNTCGIEVR